MAQAFLQPPNYPIHVEKPLEVLDPAVLQLARQVYGGYCDLSDSLAEGKHASKVERPLGVVVNQVSLRAVLIFKRLPAILPTEVFVPLNHLETELY